MAVLTKRESTPAPAVHMAEVPPSWKFTVTQYHAMIRAGILSDEDPVELLEGELVVKMPKKPGSGSRKDLLNRLLERMLKAGYYVQEQEPITLADSEPQPDLAVLVGDPADYLDRHPGPKDIQLVVEFSDTSLVVDRTIKQRVYARAGIPAYWIVNLSAGRVEVFEDPIRSRNARYRRRIEFGPGESVPVTINGREVGRAPVLEFLPKARL